MLVASQGGHPGVLPGPPSVLTHCAVGIGQHGEQLMGELAAAI
jgi:hypothetical protein